MITKRVCRACNKFYRLCFTYAKRKDFGDNRKRWIDGWDFFCPDYEIKKGCGMLEIIRT